MTKRNIIEIILILILIGIAVFWLLRSKLQAPKNFENVTSTSSESTSSGKNSEIFYLSLATTTNQKILSLENWKTFDGQKLGLKRDMTFLFPNTWSDIDMSCGDAECSGSFFLPEQSSSTHYTRVGLLGIYDEVKNAIPEKTVMILEEDEKMIEGYRAEIIHQIVTSRFGTHKEWTLIIENVEGSNGTLNRYEIHMQDIYENSKDVFMKIVNSIQIEPYSSFKKKP